MRRYRYCSGAKLYSSGSAATFKLIEKNGDGSIATFRWFCWRYRYFWAQSNFRVWSVLELKMSVDYIESWHSNMVSFLTSIQIHVNNCFWWFTTSHYNVNFEFVLVALFEWMKWMNLNLGLSYKVPNLKFTDSIPNLLTLQYRGSICTSLKP